MTRRGADVSRLEGLGLLVSVLVVCASVVAACDWLLDPLAVERPLPAPAQDEPVGPAPPPCPAVPPPPLADVTSGELLDCPDRYDGRRVRYTGEVVAAVLRRHDHAWVQLNDDRYGLELGPMAAHRTAVGGNSGTAVAIPPDVAGRIEHVGGWGVAGDVLTVTGTFRRTDRRDGGGMTIRAEAGVVTRAGQPIDHRPSPRRVTTAAFLAALTAGLAAATLRSKRL